MDHRIVIEKLNTFICDAKASVSSKKESTSDYRFCRDAGLSPIDSLFYSIYNKVCDSNDRARILLERLSRPLSHLSRTARGHQRREKISLFSDSSLMIVSRALGFVKKRMAYVVAIGLALTLGFMVASNNATQPSLEVFVNGVSVGTVDSGETVDRVLGQVEQRITDVTGACYDLPCTISYKLTSGKTSLDDGELYTALSSYSQDETCRAYGLYIDENEIAVVSNRQDITFVISTLEAQHLALTGENAHIANKIEIRFEEYASNKVINRAQLMEKLTAIQTEATEEKPVLLAPAASPEELTVTETDGDISTNIAQSLGMEKINSVVITYEAIDYETNREWVDYPTRYLEDSSLYKGQTRVSTYGRRGLADITYAVSMIDGEESSRVEYSRSYIYEPVTEVVRVGTRALPETLSEEVNEGKYMIYPVVNFRPSDKYGYRTINGVGSFHYGFDMAANFGTSIYAAASGKVIYADYNGSFGNCVKIEHADGTITLYAHCSKLLVEEGDEVTQGEVIAQVGNTGYSLGNHCHFEVIVDGHRVDPEDYIYQE